MNNLQKKLLELLVEFDSICRKNDVKYCVCSGCALGIERHGGFLPWDDDIDLFITRDNYNKLNEVMATQLPENRAWVTDKTYPEYENPLVRYVDTSTMLLMRSRIDDGSPLGVYIELFIADPYPDNEEDRIDYNKHLWVFGELKATRYTAANASGYKDIYDEKLYRKYEKQIQNEGKQKVLDEIIREHLTYRYEDCSCLCVRWALHVVILKKEWMESLVYREFEGAMLPFIKDNIDYLCNTEYGYFWNVIPKDDNRAVHNIYVDTSNSYDESSDTILSISRDAGLVEKLKKNKQDRIERKFLDMKIQEIVSIQKKAYLEAKAEQIGQQNLTISFDNLDNLKKLFKDYIKVQTGKRYALTKAKADISDDVLEAMLYVMIYNNQINVIKPILKLYEDRACTDHYKKVAEWIWTMKLERCKGNEASVQEYYSKLVDCGYKNMNECERSAMWLMTREISEKSEEDILNAYESMVYKGDAEIRKYVGDYYYNKQDLETADNWYSKVMTTRNGLILFDLKKKGYFK